MGRAFHHCINRFNVHKTEIYAHHNSQIKANITVPNVGDMERQQQSLRCHLSLSCRPFGRNILAAKPCSQIKALSDTPIDFSHTVLCTFPLDCFYQIISSCTPGFDYHSSATIMRSKHSDFQ